ncbi:MAG: acyl carrier protein [Planctomycetes bacterium]|jgi:acyl carrier protein|nr:acyl carrier protein [Planctomycetota bacterium]MDP6410839.1 acyl carrier protein [Planctomycetota bacterium]
MTDAALSRFELDTVEVLKELTEDWDTGFGGAMNAETSIVHELEFESIDVVHLVTALEARYERSDIPFAEMLMVDGRYVEDLTVGQIAVFLERHVGAAEG